MVAGERFASVMNLINSFAYALADDCRSDFLSAWISMLPRCTHIDVPKECNKIENEF